MDLHLSAQDVPRCDLCESALASTHCELCYVNLCRPCIGEHIGDEYTKHKVVPFSQRKSTLIYPMCTTHGSQRCEFQCNQCNMFVCSHCVSSEIHNGHTFSNLSEIYKFKKEIIQKDKCEFESIIFSTYEAIITEIESGVAKIDGEYENLSEAVIKQGEELQKEIKNSVEEMNGEIKKMRTKHVDILHDHLEEMRKIRSDIHQSLETLREVTESNDVALVMGFKSRNKEFFRLPQKVEVTGPKFDPKEIDRQQVNEVFGTLLPLSTRSVEHGYTVKMPVKHLLDDPELIGAVDTGSRKLYSVSCYRDVNIWVSGRYSTIKCYDNQGSLIKSIEIISDAWPSDIAVTSNGYLVYSDWATGTIKERLVCP
ncbi:E3 ubiquitin-protein ligase TRIM71-like [Saccostrea cucullata]|uniref:E3 ubiquitin-protein ligase TRIM71-like n=1 Tax=Saccostrea cuccullata TaxID=36930 RepID=UPI002ED19724